MGNRKQALQVRHGRRRVAAAAVVLWASTAAGGKGGVHVDELKRVVEVLAEVAPDAYRTRDPKVPMVVPRKILRLGWHGVALGAPDRVVLDPPAPPAPSLSVLLVSAGTSARSKSLPLVDNATVAVSDLGAGTVQVAPAFVGNPEKSPEPPPPPSQGAGSHPAPGDAEDEDSESAGAVWLNVGERLGMPLYPAHLVVRVVNFDQVTNPAAVELVRGDGQAAQIAPLSPQAAMAVVHRNHDAAEHGGGLPSMSPSKSTPAIKEPGIAVALARRTAVQGEVVPLHAALKMTLPAGALVTPRHVNTDADGRDLPPYPRAIVSATVLIAFANRNHPARATVEIPVWASKELKAGAPVEAAFSIDLAKVLPPGVLPGTCQVYVLAGPYLAGPEKLVITAAP